MHILGRNTMVLLLKIFFKHTVKKVDPLAEFNKKNA